MSVEEQFESVFHKVALQATGQWLTLSLLSSTGSQRVSAGCPGWADFPEEGKGRTWHSLFCTCFNQQSRASWALLYMPESAFLHRVVSDVKQWEGKQAQPHTGQSCYFQGQIESLRAGLWLRRFSPSSVGHSEQDLHWCRACGRGGQEPPAEAFYGLLWQASKAGVFLNCLNEQVPVFPLLSLYLSFSAVLGCCSTTAQWMMIIR